MSSSCWVHRNANDLVTKCTSGSRNLIRLGGERARCHHWRRRNVENVRRAGRIPTCARSKALGHLFSARSILPPAPAGSRCDDKPCNTVLATATHRCYTEIRRSESVCCFNGLGERRGRLRILPPQPAFAEFSPIIIAGAFVLPPTSIGTIEQSTTRRPVKLQICGSPKTSGAT